MLFNVILPVATPITVYANEPPIRVHMDEHLVPGTTDSTPLNRPGIPENRSRVYMDFALERFGSYRLTYRLADNTIVAMYIDVDANNVAHVRFVHDRPGLDHFYVHLAPAVGDFVPIAQYVSHPARPNVAGWRVVASTLEPPIINSVRPPGLPLTEVWPPLESVWPLPTQDPMVDPPPGWPTASPWPPVSWDVLVPNPYPDPGLYIPVTPPQFEISNNRGFSFTWRGSEIHIRFDSDGRFHFEADHFDPGVIYEIELHRFPDPTDTDTYDLVGRTLINSGITGPGAGREIAIFPFANAVPTGLVDDTSDRRTQYTRRMGNRASARASVGRS
jgi:hypothetical protein